MRTCTISEAAELTGLSRKAIARRVDRGTLRSVVRDGRRRIPVSELERAGLLPDEGDVFDPERLLLPSSNSAEAAIPADALVAFLREMFDRFERQAGELAQYRALTTQAESLRMAGELADLRTRLAALESPAEPAHEPAAPPHGTPQPAGDPRDRTLWLPGQLEGVRVPRPDGSDRSPPLAYGLAAPQSLQPRRRGFPRGFRFAAEALFIVAVAVGAWSAHLQPMAIVAGMALAWVLAAIFEALSWRQRRPGAVRIPPPQPRA
jgi:excisionase family DNA binding protein